MTLRTDSSTAGSALVASYAGTAPASCESMGGAGSGGKVADSESSGGKLVGLGGGGSVAAGGNFVGDPPM